MIEIYKEPPASRIDLRRHVFATRGYLAAKSNSFGWIVSDTLLLPFYVDTIAGFRRLVFTDAPLPVQSGEPDVREVQAFLDAAIDAVGEARLCDAIWKPQANAVFAAPPSAAVAAEWGTYETQIDRPDDDLLAGCHQKHRNVIRKAMKDGVSVEPVADLLTVYEGVRGTMRRQQLPYYPSLPFLRRLLGALPHNVLTLGAFLRGVMQGVAVVPFDAVRGYYLYGGSIERPAGGAMNLLQYEVMRALRNRGVSWYDFVGARLNVRPATKYAGIQMFKERFGARLRRGHTFRFVYSPWRYRAFTILVAGRFALSGRWYRDPVDELRGEAVARAAVAAQDA